VLRILPRPVGFLLRVLPAPWKLAVLLAVVVVALCVWGYLARQDTKPRGAPYGRVLPPQWHEPGVPPSSRVAAPRFPAMDAAPTQGTLTVVVMGVSGCGKTTVAQDLAARLGWEYAEGDDFHPASNVEKMRAGIPLTDEDRAPWLQALAEWIGEHERAGRSVVVTCSALKRSYRDILRAGHPSVWFAHVSADPQVLRERVEHRTNHYMPASLLDSQLATLEPLQPDEAGATLSSAGSPDVVVDEVLAALPSAR
jgi:gluconokinase